MSDDLVSRLKSCAKDCTMLGDEVGAAFFNEVATALTEARAEIETKTQAIADMARQIYEMRSKHDTLRARVREVVGPFADAASDLDDTDKDSTDIWEAPCAMQVNVGHLRAARQLNEDLK